MNLFLRNSSFFICLIALFASCSDSKGGENSGLEPPPSVTIPLEVYKKVYGVTSEITIENGYVYINTNGVPDHKSPYFMGTKWHDDKYEAYDATNPNKFHTGAFNLNPNRVSELSISFKVPNSPSKSSSASPTAMGPIGVSLNGVPFYNQYAGMNALLTREVNSFDNFNGHPAPLSPGAENGSGGRYHYHMEPFWLTTNASKDALVGFLLDGFPVYGPEEGGKTVTSSDLDSYHGHTLATKEFPNGIYHYHTTGDAPYINGSGYYGSPGTVSQ
jgi:hypothetical protein|tara:strand:+ start:21612 stop:22430 length:819 start_codon:yes stop_codon:yes gene_type:complete